MLDLNTQSVARVLNDTIDVMVDIAGEAPAAASAGDLVALVFREDRRQYVGIALMAAAVVVLLLTAG